MCLYIFSQCNCPPEITYGFAFLSLWRICHTSLHLDLTSWSFLCTVSKVEEDVDEGVQSETEGSEKIPFAGKDPIKEDENATESLQFEELTEEVKLALQQN